MSREEEPRDEADGRLRLWGRFTSVLLVFIGALGLLRAGISGPAETVALLIVHPVAAIVYLLAGLVGIAMVTTARGRSWFAIVVGGGLVAWGVLGLVLGGSPTEFFTDDRETVAVHLVLGLSGLGAALAARRQPVAQRSG